MYYAHKVNTKIITLKNFTQQNIQCFVMIACTSVMKIYNLSL